MSRSVGSGRGVADESLVKSAGKVAGCGAAEKSDEGVRLCLAASLREIESG